jgi:ArsR family transcriptional regulator
MLEQAHARLAGVAGTELRLGELESLPLGANELDAAVLSLVLHHTPEPKRVLDETFRVLKTDGRLLLIDLLPHDRIEYRERMGHVWLGFSANQVTEWLEGAGFENVRVIALSPDPGAKAPGLFVATGSRRPETGNRTAHE